MADQIKWHDPETLEKIKGKLTQKGVWTERVNITDARKGLWLPSCTSVIKNVYGYNHQLVEYLKKQTVQAAWNTPRVEDYDTWKGQVLSLAIEHGNVAADLGTAIHAQVARFIEHNEEPNTPVGVTCTASLARLLNEIGAEGVAAETPLGGKLFGFCGTPDIYVKRCSLRKLLLHVDVFPPKDMAEYGELIVDLKSTNLATYKKPHDSWKYQAGGYAVLKEIGRDSLFLQWVVDRDDGRSVYEAYTNLLDWKAAYERTFENWVLIKEYDPRIEA